MYRATKSNLALAFAALTAMVMLPAAYAGSSSSQGAYLGVHIDELTPEQATKVNGSGVVVVSIDHDGPACKAGLQTNDIITAVNGKKVSDPEQLAEIVHGMSPGTTADLSIMRNGQARNIKVKLAKRNEVAWSTPAPNAPTMHFASPPLPPVPYTGDVEVPLMTPASARRGIVVEPLTSQLADFFAVPGGQGVLVRTVQQGSTGAKAGLKAGDVIYKIDGEPVRDLADWRRSMHSLNGKSTFSIIRDKREQTVELALPGPASELRTDEDWDQFGVDMNAFNEQMQLLGPEIENQMELAQSIRPKDIEKMQREIEKSVRRMEPEMRQQTKEIAKQSAEFQKTLKLSQKDLQEMQRQVSESMKAITPEIQEQMKTIGPQIEEQMKTLRPQIEQQMQELQKQMEQLKKFPCPSEKANQF